MFQYEKKLQYPVKIKTPNPALAKIIVSQLGGPHGEMGAATPVPEPALQHAGRGGEGSIDRYWCRRIDTEKISIKNSFGIF